MMVSLVKEIADFIDKLVLTNSLSRSLRSLGRA